MRNLFSFTISGETFGLPLSSIETVVRSVELVRLPQGSPELLGLLDFRGVLIPIVNIHARLNLPQQPINVDQRIVIARSQKGTVGFVADCVDSVHAIGAEKCAASDEIYPDMDQYVRDIIWINDNKVLYCDPDEFLFVDPQNIPQPPLEIDEV